MAGSSPAARTSQQWSSPDRPRMSSISCILSESRNTAISHQDALARAQAEHDRVREAAIRVYHDHELQEEQKRLLEQQKRILEQQKLEEERIRAEERLRAEEERLRALKAKTVPQLPPEPPTPVAHTNGSAAAPAQIKATPIIANSGALSSSKPPLFGVQQPASTNGLSGHANGTVQPNPSQPFGQPKTIPQNQTLSGPSPFTQPFLQPNGLSAAAPAKPPVAIDVDRYVEIHKNLKKLRASLLQQSKLSPPLKKRMGDMRRELRKNMGQLVGEKGGNKKQVCSSLFFDEV